MAMPIIVTYRQEAIWTVQMPHSAEGRSEFSKQFIYKVTFNVIETPRLAAAPRNRACLCGFSSEAPNEVHELRKHKRNSF